MFFFEFFLFASLTLASNQPFYAYSRDLVSFSLLFFKKERQIFKIFKICNIMSQQNNQPSTQNPRPFVISGGASNNNNNQRSNPPPPQTVQNIQVCVNQSKRHFYFCNMSYNLYKHLNNFFFLADFF